MSAINKKTLLTASFLTVFSMQAASEGYLEPGLILGFTGDITMGEFSARSRKLTTPISPVTNAVVFLSPASLNDPQEGDFRLTGVNNLEFTAHFHNWDYNGWSHEDESGHYLAVQKGNYTLAGGGQWQVGTTTHDAKLGTFVRVDFATPFMYKPYVFTELQTANGTDAATVVVKDVDKNGFWVALLEQEANMPGSHTNIETIGFMAVSTPEGRDTYGGTDNLYSFEVSSFKLDEKVTEHKGARYFLQEERSADSEWNHAEEIIHVLTIDGVSFLQQVSYNGADPAVIRSTWLDNLGQYALDYNRN